MYIKYAYPGKTNEILSISHLLVHKSYLASYWSAERFSSAASRSHFMIL